MTTETPAVETAPEQESAPENVETTPEPQAPEQESQPDTVEQDTFDREYVEKLRKEAADYRTKRKEEADRANQLETKMNAIIDGLKGLTGDGAPEQTPEQVIEALTAERDNAAQQLAQMRTDQALTAAATQAGADAELLTLVLKGKGALTDLDPTADDFAAQVAALVDAEVAANPKLRATPAVPQSSGSTPEDTTSPRTGQLTRADMANMTPREINEAVAAGRFRDVLGG